jgi:hypothetical protein
MIKFQFKIIIDKGGFKKIIKPFLSKSASTLVLVLVVLVLSAIIGLGIHLVLAGTGPTQPPPGGNVREPVNVSNVEQTKEGDLSQTNDTWHLYSAAGNIEAIGFIANGGIGAPSITSYDLLLTQNLLQVDGKIYAPNQGREQSQSCLSTVSGDCQYSTPHTSVIECPEGKFLYKVQVASDGVSSQGWCAAPFKKTQGVIYGGGGNPDEQNPNTPITWPRPAR